MDELQTKIIIRKSRLSGADYFVQSTLSRNKHNLINDICNQANHLTKNPSAAAVVRNNCDGFNNKLQEEEGTKTINQI
jgi:hypothetical protein